MKHTNATQTLISTLAAHGLTLTARRAPLSPDLRVVIVGELKKGKHAFRFVRSYGLRVKLDPLEAMADALALISLGYGETLENYALSVNSEGVTEEQAREEFVALTKERELLAGFMTKEAREAIAALWDSF